MEEKTTIVIDVQLDQNNVANQLAAVNREMAALRAENAAMKKSVKEGKAEWEDVSQALANNEARLKQLKASQSALSSQVVQSTHTQLEYGDSLKEQAALLTELRTRYQSLGKTERESAQGQQLLKHIQELDAAIKAADYSQGQFQRNVGNYPGAMQPLQDQLVELTARLEDLRNENKQGTDEFANVEKQIADVNAAIAQLSGTVEGMAQDGQNLKQQMRELTENLIAMKMRGEENTEQYRQMLEQLGKMKDAMIDTQNQVKQMASDTSTLNSVLAGAQAAAGGFSVALGVMNLVGDKDTETAKELAEAQAKLQSAIAITTGLQAVQNALQKESALMMGVNKIKILAAAAAQKVYAAATRDAEAAQAVFNRVAKSNVYVWLAGIILTVVGAIAAFTRGSKEQEEQTERTNIQLKNQLDYLKQLTDQYKELQDRATTEAEIRLESAKALGLSTEEIRKRENELYETRQKSIDQEKERLGYSVSEHRKMAREYELLLADYEDNVKRMEEAAGTVPESVTSIWQETIDKQKQALDNSKELLDLWDDVATRDKQLQNERSATQTARAKEDEEAERAAAEAAKKRHEERIAQIRKEREETAAAFAEMMQNVKTAEQLADQKEADNQALAESIQKTLNHVGLLGEAVESLPVLPLNNVAEGIGNLATSAAAAPSALDQFSAAYQANAQEIMETSAALESSFSSVASMYQQMAKDESRSEEEREKAARKAKAWSKIQIATNAGAAVAKGVATAVDVGFPAAIPAIATMTATILAAIAQAKSLLAEGFESGGVIGGYHGVSMGHDNTAVVARRGEMVLNANQQRQLFEIANGGSKAGGMYSALADALRSMPAPVLVYSEFKDFTNKVATLDEAAKLR